jgi:hypothetical protein
VTIGEYKGCQNIIHNWIPDILHHVRAITVAHERQSSTSGMRFLARFQFCPSRSLRSGDGAADSGMLARAEYSVWRREKSPDFRSY